MENRAQFVEIGRYVIWEKVRREFGAPHEMILSNKDLAQRLDELENKADLMELKHDTFEHNTRVQLKQVFEAIRALMTPPTSEPVKKRPIGFVEQDEKPGAPRAAKAKK